MKLKLVVIDFILFCNYLCGFLLTKFIFKIYIYQTSILEIELPLTLSKVESPFIVSMYIPGYSSFNSAFTCNDSVVPLPVFIYVEE